MRPKEFGKVRYAYGVAMALLIGGTAFSLATGEAGAQVAQNAPEPRHGARAARRCLRRPVARLQPAVVNISTKQRVPVAADRPVRGILPPVRPRRSLGRRRAATVAAAASSRALARPARSAPASSSRPTATSSPTTTWSRARTAPARSTRVTVTTTDRKEYPARIVGRDETSDLALLKIEGRNLPFVNWGDSTKARVGDWVIAIGNPYGVGSTVTAGIISALHRGITGIGAYDRYIQTDAAINMGNSGGPMFDLNGNVIGINSALISPTGASVGIGLAIPAEAAKPVIDSLMRGQRPQRGYLGVSLQPLDDDLAPSARHPERYRRARPLGGPGRPGGARRPAAGRRHRPR